MDTITLPVTETLNKLPEVVWDRFAGDGVDNVSVFGWIERDDGRSDFAFVMIDKDGPWLVSTSSAKYSAEFSARLGMGSDGHTGCRRVEDHFEGVSCVRLQEATGEHAPAKRSTPEADAIMISHSFTQFVPADFARKLERQRDEFADRLNSPVRCHSGHQRLPLALWDCPDCVQKIRDENAELRRLNIECSRLASIAASERDDAREADAKHREIARIQLERITKENSELRNQLKS